MPTITKEYFGENRTLADVRQHAIDEARRGNYTPLKIVIEKLTSGKMRFNGKPLKFTHSCLVSFFARAEVEASELDGWLYAIDGEESLT